MYRAAIFISHWNWVNRRHTWNLILRQRSGRRNMTGWQPGRTRHDASWWCTMTHRDVSWCAMMAYLPQKIGKNWKKLAKVEKKIGKNVTMKLDKIGTNCTKRQLTMKTWWIIPNEKLIAQVATKRLLGLRTRNKIALSAKHVWHTRDI